MIANPVDETRKSVVIEHLSNAPVVVSSAAQVNDVTTGDFIGQLEVHTDGRWLWFSDLAHYVAAYDAPLPPDFVAEAAQDPAPTLSQDELMAVAREMRGA